MSVLATKKFWAATLERTVRTAAQTAIATIGTTAALTGVDWLLVGNVTGLASILAVLTAVATAGIGGDGPGITEGPLDTDPRPEGRHYR